MKKFLCTLLCLMLVFTMMPMATGVAFANESQSDWVLLKDAMTTATDVQSLTTKTNNGKDIFTVSDADGTRTITLLSDITASSTDSALVVSDTNIVLNLNGHVLDRGLSEGTAKKDGYVILIKGELTLEDKSDNKEGAIKGGNTNDAGGGVYIKSGTFDMNGGTITGNKVTNAGGGVCIESGTFNMNGGNITGNTATSSGGGVYNDNGTFTMIAGTITNNTSKNGGGVYNIKNFIMSGGEISSNTSIFGGGGICNVGEATMTNGKIINNSVAGDDESAGGGVANYDSGKFAMENGEISGNTAEYHGGGIYNYAELTMKGGKISGNTSNYGGGVYNDGTSNAIFTMTGGKITDNTADYDGGGIYNVFLYAKITMTGGEVSGNTAELGGGVFNTSSGEISMTYSTITDNTAYDAGGGVYNSEKFTMTNSAITDNVAAYCGGVYNDGMFGSAIFTMINSEVIGNTSQKGGGIGNYEDAEFIMNGGEICGNRADYKGGIDNLATMSISGKVIINDNECSETDSPKNLATSKPIKITGELTGSNIKITHMGDNDKHNTGVLTASFTNTNPGAQLGDFFTYDGPDTYRMILNNDGELEVVENTEPEPTRPSYHGSSIDYAQYQAILEQAKKQQEELDAKKAEEEKLEEHEKLVKEAKAVIEKTEFKATSTKQTKLNGKKAVKIKWEVVGGDYDLSDFDGFDVFRSNKKNSGYTKTPFFTTTKWTYTNNKDLKVGKTYYYKVRAWKMVDGEKVYTGWSTKAWRTVK